ncbi:group II truncated hemoglobin [Sphingomonas montanisoli]|uniref:Group II truncated hemoglobin n=1 Tax=Sphingomonas montanisoli TaxID=2606412 RepID=A0A5D9C7N3_9SPHN|nr:group II truncated hemoglobin [Sphingomonas montanisoli]
MTDVSVTHGVPVQDRSEPASPIASTPSGPATAASFATPYQALGGATVIEAIIDRFYDLVEHDPAYAELRAMHAADLGPVRRSLARFLTGWCGGPRDWFREDRPGGSCVMSLHRSLAIDPATAGQWIDAMTRAIGGQPGLDESLAALMVERLDLMVRGMINRAVGEDAAARRQAEATA